MKDFKADVRGFRIVTFDTYVYKICWYLNLTWDSFNYLKTPFTNYLIYFEKSYFFNFKISTFSMHYKYVVVLNMKNINVEIHLIRKIIFISDFICSQEYLVPYSTLSSPSKRPTFSKIHEGARQRWFLFFQNFPKFLNFFTKRATRWYFNHYRIEFK